MSGLPDVTELRSISRYGISSVTVVFEDGTPLFFARQLVQERLPEAGEDPARLRQPGDDPADHGPGRDLPLHRRGRRLLADGAAESPRLADRLSPAAGVRVSSRSTPGAAWPSSSRSECYPEKLVAHGIALAAVFEAVEKNNAMAGSAYLERGASNC